MHVFYEDDIHDLNILPEGEPVPGTGLSLGIRGVAERGRGLKGPKPEGASEAWGERGALEASPTFG